MRPLETVNLRPLMKLTEGRKDISIGIIDGPIELSHPAFINAKIRTVNRSQLIGCKRSNSMACTHGTFIAGILVGNRNSAAPAICPKCEIIIRPIFAEDTHYDNNSIETNLPTSSLKEFADAIIEVVDAGVKIINLSVSISTSSIVTCRKLREAYEYAIHKNVLVIAAAGNQASLGYASALYPTWVIPVAACDENGKIFSLSNIGPSIGKRGLLAPGLNITSVFAGGNYARLSGTSFAVPFVTGGIALLWSLYPNATVVDIISSIFQTHDNLHMPYRRAIIPRIFDAESARLLLEKMFGA